MRGEVRKSRAVWCGLMFAFLCGSLAECGAQRPVTLTEVKPIKECSALPSVSLREALGTDVRFKPLP